MINLFKLTSWFCLVMSDDYCVLSKSCLQAVRVEHCERVHVIAAAKRICIANCRECVFFLGVNQRPLIVGDNHKLQVCDMSLFSILYSTTFNSLWYSLCISWVVLDNYLPECGWVDSMVLPWNNLNLIYPLYNSCHSSLEP